MRWSVVRIGCCVAMTLCGSTAYAKDFRSDPPPPPASQCPGDRVVWVNTHSGVYHLSDQTWFGHTINGKYLCERQALAEGDRPTRNGQ
jgi:hypothetical protein